MENMNASAAALGLNLQKYAANYFASSWPKLFLRLEINLLKTRPTGTFPRSSLRMF